MPKSRQRKDRKKLKKLCHNDILRIQEAWNKKIDEYMGMETVHLTTLRDSKTVKGNYLKALLRAIEMKQQLQDKQIQEYGAFAD